MVGFGIRGHIVAMIRHEFCGDGISLVWLDWSKQDSNVLEVLADSILPYSGLIEREHSDGLRPSSFSLLRRAGRALQALHRSYEIKI